jgi:2'-5' RNA ligase
MKRLFVAIKILPTEHFLAIYYQILKQFENESIKWVMPQNMHLTLKFFGETAEDRIPEIEGVLSSVFVNYRPFQFHIEGIGIFGSSYRPRVIWFGIHQGDDIKKMARDLHKKLEIVGFENDRQNFVPHLTVGRIKKELIHKRSFQQKIDPFNNQFIQDVKVNEVILFESILKPTGPVYKVVNCFKL